MGKKVLGFKEFSLREKMNIMEDEVFSDSIKKEHLERIENPKRMILDPGNIKSNPPPHKSSKERANEILKIKAFVQKTGDKQSNLDAKRYDEGIIKKFKRLCKKMELEFDKKYFKELKSESKDFILKEKYRWNIPRPYQSAKTLDIPFKEFVEELEPDSPSYPSAHSFYGHIIAEVLIKKYPEKKEEFLRLANLISLSRILAGVHYMPDVLEGKILAQKLVNSGRVKIPDLES